MEVVRWVRQCAATTVYCKCTCGILHLEHLSWSCRGRKEIVQRVLKKLPLADVNEASVSDQNAISTAFKREDRNAHAITKHFIVDDSFGKTENGLLVGKQSRKNLHTDTYIKSISTCK